MGDYDFDLGGFEDLGGGYYGGDFDLADAFDFGDVLGSFGGGDFDLGEALSFGDVLGSLGGGDLDLAEAFNFGDVLSALGSDQAEAFNFGDILSSIGGDQAEAFNFNDVINALGGDQGDYTLANYIDSVAGGGDISFGPSTEDEEYLKDQFWKQTLGVGEEEPKSYGTTFGLKTPGDAGKVLRQAEGETDTRFLGEGLREPEVPGMSYLGGGTGIYKEVPAEFDPEGNKIGGTGGYITQMGFIPYEATPVLGDPRSFINDPRVLGRPVFTTDKVRLPDGTVFKTDPKTGMTTREVIKTDTKTTGGGGSGGGGRSGGGGGRTSPLVNKDNALLMALLGGLLGLLSKGSAPKGPVGYKGEIPRYTATRGPAQSPTAGGRRPGGAGIPILTGGVTYAAGGGLMGLAAGGRPARYLRGGTDGMADKIKTDIDGKQPARLSSGEFVIPADVVGALGSGNSEAGAEVLYDMMDRVRKHAHGHTKQIKQANPKKVLPA